MAKHLPEALYAYANDSQSYFSFKPWPLWLLGKISKWLRNVLQRFAFGWSLIGYQLMTRRLNILSSPLTGSVSIESIAGGTCVSVISGCMVWKSYVYACTHVVKVCSKAFRGLHTIRHIGKFLAEESTKSLVHAFVTSHLDYCNSLLYGIPKYQCDGLQRILNAAARVICVIPKFNHITPFTIKLHWLLVYFWIQLKILLLVLKTLEGKAPVYIRDLLKPKVAGGYNLR